MSQAPASVDKGRQAAALGRWREAYAAFSEAGDRDLPPEDLELFAEAAWWTCHVDQGLALRRRAYTAFDASGDKPGAARVALSLHFDHTSRGEFAVAHGWFARAERLLEGLPESPEYARLVLMRGFGTLATGSPADATPNLDLAAELAERLGDRDVQTLALTGKGIALVHLGEVDRGLALLDESTAAAVGGGLKPFTAGLVYCCTISSCQEVGDYRRAAEWTEAASQWCDMLDVTGFPGACRIHRAQIMRLRGNWPAAEQQAIAACDELQDFDRSITADGFYEIGEIRRRRGDFAAALEAYRKADELGRDPQPGLALLRLAEGKVEAALQAARRTLETVTDPLARLQQLPAQVEIALAAGDLRAARAANDELVAIVETYRIQGAPSPAFDATANLGSGQIKLAEADWPGAVRCLRRAREEWQRVGAPYEAAQARALLGVAYRRMGDEDGALTELEAALTAFERLGARLDEARVKELLGRLETRRTFLFTDIVGSTKLLETLGDQKWKKLLGRHDQLLRDCIVGAGGEVIKQTGDGFFASFERPAAAVQAAIAIQRALDAEVVAPDVRIGIHAGGAFVPDGSLPDYGGHGVHTAARIGSAAGPGEILVSRETLDGALGSFSTAPPRPEVLKGFTEPVVVLPVLWR